MRDVRRIHGTIQHYVWGDQEFIPRLLGLEPDGRPWAELWLGTHEHGPARVDDGRPLSELTGELPYLLKVLAAAEPLSLQVHPDAEQAVEGHARGVYPDDRPKPELLCALTPFEALCGVRPTDATLELLDAVGVANTSFARYLAIDGPGAVFSGLYRGSIDAAPVVAACADADRPEAGWVTRLAERYPGEPSVAATLLLNHVVLEPGEALRLDAGNLHAYLRGAGVELMGASDNVVRAGLTVKPVDPDEVMHIFDPTPLEHPTLPAADRYELPAAGVALLRLAPDRRHTAVEREISIDRTGASYYLSPGDELVATAETFVVTPL